MENGRWATSVSLALPAFLLLLLFTPLTSASHVDEGIVNYLYSVDPSSQQGFNYAPGFVQTFARVSFEVNKFNTDFAIGFVQGAADMGIGLAQLAGMAGNFLWNTGVWVVNSIINPVETGKRSLQFSLEAKSLIEKFFLDPQGNTNKALQGSTDNGIEFSKAFAQSYWNYLTQDVYKGHPGRAAGKATFEAVTLIVGGGAAKGAAFTGKATEVAKVVKVEKAASTLEKIHQVPEAVGDFFKNVEKTAGKTDEVVRIEGKTDNIAVVKRTEGITTKTKNSEKMEELLNSITDAPLKKQVMKIHSEIENFISEIAESERLGMKINEKWKTRIPKTEKRINPQMSIKQIQEKINQMNIDLKSLSGEFEKAKERVGQGYKHSQLELGNEAFGQEIDLLVRSQEGIIAEIIEVKNKDSLNYDVVKQFDKYKKAGEKIAEMQGGTKPKIIFDLGDAGLLDNAIRAFPNHVKNTRVAGFEVEVIPSHWIDEAKSFTAPVVDANKGKPAFIVVMPSKTNPSVPNATKTSIFPADAKFKAVTAKPFSISPLTTPNFQIVNVEPFSILSVRPSINSNKAAISSSNSKLPSKAEKTPQKQAPTPTIDKKIKPQAQKQIKMPEIKLPTVKPVAALQIPKPAATKSSFEPFTILKTTYKNVFSLTKDMFQNPFKVVTGMFSKPAAQPTAFQPVSKQAPNAQNQPPSAAVQLQYSPPVNPANQPLSVIQPPPTTSVAYQTPISNSQLTSYTILPTPGYKPAPLAQVPQIDKQANQQSSNLQKQAKKESKPQKDKATKVESMVKETGKTAINFGEAAVNAGAQAINGVIAAGSSFYNSFMGAAHSIFSTPDSKSTQNVDKEKPEREKAKQEQEQKERERLDKERKAKKEKETLEKARSEKEDKERKQKEPATGKTTEPTLPKSQPTPQNSPPTISISNPWQGATINYAYQFTIAGTASDSDGSVLRVEVQIGTEQGCGDGNWRTASGTTSWQLQWQPSAGKTNCVIRVKAIDNSGSQSTVSSVTFSTSAPVCTPNSLISCSGKVKTTCNSDGSASFGNSVECCSNTDCGSATCSNGKLRSGTCNANQCTFTEQFVEGQCDYSSCRESCQNKVSHICPANRDKNVECCAKSDCAPSFCDGKAYRELNSCSSSKTCTYNTGQYVVGECGYKPTCQITAPSQINTNVITTITVKYQNFYADQPGTVAVNCGNGGTAYTSFCSGASGKCEATCSPYFKAGTYTIQANIQGRQCSTATINAAAPPGDAIVDGFKRGVTDLYNYGKSLLPRF